MSNVEQLSAAMGSSNGSSKHLVFSLSKERYGFDISHVQEIIKVTSITRVPRSPHFIKGVINLRGKIIPVMDLRAKFDMDRVPFDEKTCIIVVSVRKDSQEISIGIIVDSVVEVSDFSSEEIESSPNYGLGVNSSFVRGLGRKGGQGICVLLDLEEIVVHSNESADSSISKGR